MSKIALFTSLILLDVLNANLRTDGGSPARLYKLQQKSIEPVLLFSEFAHTTSKDLQSKYAQADSRRSSFFCAGVDTTASNNSTIVFEEGIDASDDDYHSFDDNASHHSVSFSEDEYCDEECDEDDIDMLFEQLSSPEIGGARVGAYYDRS